MVVLGVADGLDTGACLILDDRPVAVEHQERHDRIPHTRQFPWKAIDAALMHAGLGPRDVDLIAVAGRFTPPFFLRRHPELRRTSRDPFSVAVDAKVFFQAMLRQTGWGAMEADRAADWLDQRFRERGFEHQRIVLVDMHRALAAAAYRSQADDTALILTLHPMGDGVACAVHRGCAGQVDKLWEQKGFSSLHVHLQRCASAIGFEPVFEDQRMWTAAGRGRPVPDLVTALESELHADGPRLSRRSFPMPESRWESVYKQLSTMDKDAAAASVYENLRAAVCKLVEHHIAEHGIPVLTVGGAIFDNPRLCADVAALDAVERLWVNPEPGWGSLGLGAAVSYAGLHPRLLEIPGLGQSFDDEACQAAALGLGLDGDQVEDPARHVVNAVAEGKGVGRFAGPGGFGRAGSGSRSVLVRGDRPDDVDRVRRALGRDPDEEPLAIVLADEPSLDDLDRSAIAGPLRYGVIAPLVPNEFAMRYPALVSDDGRAHLMLVDRETDRALFDILVGLRDRTECGAIAVWPLARGNGPVVTLPGDAVRLYRDVGMDALLLGSTWIAG